MINVPPVIAAALRRGAAVAISVSGGKDSQAMERALAGTHEEQSWPGDFFAIHADVGAPFDWPWTISLCERNAQALGHPLHVARRDDGRNLLQTIWRRVRKTTPERKPGFPSPAARYCTSDLKAAVLDSWAARHYPGSGLIIFAIGLRAEESRRRAKRQAVEVRKDITTGRLKGLDPETALEAWLGNPAGRLALNWHPILDWSEARVWEACLTSRADLLARRQMFRLGLYAFAFAGWPCSPTYVLTTRQGHALERHSCAMCLFFTAQDIQVGATFNLALHREIAAMEQHSGFAWQKDRPVSGLDVQHQAIPEEALRIQPLPQGYGGDHGR